ncbi:hypothetical protein [Micrococcus lylae]|uniref:hypothetical protein n=1 Tax=Micrococcus lylae TaxID=1273 RepID=UPI0015E0D7E9|nr:hypothetical protein [Micrococcus lylae]WIK82151.1 hypothetical protein CJ228_011285 [Micrococcus lylae]
MLRSLVNDMLCRLGFHRFGLPVLAGGGRSCYRSDYCRGRTHWPLPRRRWF